MATRLRVKNTKRNHDTATAYAKTKAPVKHKRQVDTSRIAKKKKAYRA